MTTTDDRSRRSTCPSWCETIHAEGDAEPDDHRGLRWSAVRADDGYWVDIATVQNKDGDVVVWAGADEGEAASGLS